MRRALIIGVGAGGVDQVTAEAVGALRRVDVFVVADKRGVDPGAEDLVRLRRAILDRHVPHGSFRVVEVADPKRDRRPSDYGRAVRDWHAARVDAYERVLREEVRDGGVAGFLVWGDPAFYDSTIRVVEQIRQRGAVPLDVDVVAGVSAVQILAARHRLVLNRVGGPITFTTGRRLAETVDKGADDIVVMLDGGLACGRLRDPDRWEMWWGANLGTEGEVLVTGRLDRVLDEVRAARDQAKRRCGWVMDTYLLRRLRSSSP